MRVLHFYKSALPETFGGVEKVIDQIARGTGELGVKNVFLSLSESPSKNPTQFEGYELITAKRNFEIASNGFSYQSLSLFKTLADKSDLIHFHFPWPFGDLIHLLVSSKKPSIVTYHSDIVKQKYLLQLYKPIQKIFLTSVDHIVATSPNYLHTSPVLRSFLSKTSVIPIGLDIHSYPKSKTEFVKLFQMRFGNRFFLFIGALRYYKGLKYLLKAASLVNYPIVIAGSGHIEAELRCEALNNQLNNVFFLGDLSEDLKSSLIEASFAVVLPSHLRSEAFGVFLLEGAMFAKPLISCDIGTGTTFINIDKETGLVVLPSNPISLSNAMKWLWKNPYHANEMGRNAQSRFWSLFTAKKMANSYFTLYKNIISDISIRDS